MKKIKTNLHSADYGSSMNRHIFAAVPKGSRCLDVGCWNGNLGKMLMKEKACLVDGVDVVPNMLEEAKRNGYGETFRINLNDDRLDTSLITKQYEVIIFADVLEHTVNPKAVLEFFSQFLEPQGIMVISLPNVAFFMNRMQLLFGNWNYREFGILDKTHLKFYTLQTAQELLDQAGLAIKVSRPYNQFGILKHFDPPLFPSLFAYQLLFVAGHRDTHQT